MFESCLRQHSLEKDERHMSPSRFLALVFLLFAIQSAALQTPDGAGAADNGFGPAACQVRVVANEVVVSDAERRAAAYQLKPPGIIFNPGQWPYFAWPTRNWA